MAEDREADSSDESASAARPNDESVEPTEDEELVDEHVAPQDAREPTVEELEQLLESDDADAPPASLHDVDGRSAESDDATDTDTDKSGDNTDDEPGTGSSKESAKESAKELVSVGAAATPAKKARGKKDRATAKQKQPVERAKRTTPVSFTKEAVGELRKVVYPTASQLGNYFVVVLVFVLIIIGFVSLLDLGFGWVIVRVFS